MMPVCMLQNIAQPHRNPTGGPKTSRRNTYTPPVRGNAEESSAQIKAPTRVSTPASAQTSAMPPASGTSRVISDGCTKIEAPMMIPTTIAVASGRRIVQRSSVMRRLRPGVLVQQHPRCPEPISEHGEATGKEGFFHGHEDLPSVLQQIVEAFCFVAAVHHQREIGAAHGLKAIRWDVRAEKHRLAELHPRMEHGIPPVWRNVCRLRQLTVRRDLCDFPAEVLHV